MDSCGPNLSTVSDLKIAAIFVLLASAFTATTLPIVCRRSYRSRIPDGVFRFVKTFGSGVIAATGMIHLMNPAVKSFASECLSPAWHSYPWPFAIALVSLYLTFVLELVAYRFGLRKMGALSAASQPPLHPYASFCFQPCDVGEASSSRTPVAPLMDGNNSQDVESDQSSASKRGSVVEEGQVAQEREEPIAAQIIGVAILEFGILFHSVIIGMTLANAEEEFKTLFIVLIFHQAFEGMALGSRLSALRLPSTWAWLPYVGAAAYALTTPTGMSVGLGMRESISLHASAGAATRGILDSASAGILIYTSTVELMAHDFVFNPSFHNSSLSQQAVGLGCFGAGAGIMALLAYWA